MEDAIHPGDRPPHGLWVAQVPLDQLDVADRLQVLAPAGREVVEDADAVASSPERLGDVRTDEAGAAGHHVGLSLAHPEDST